MINLIRMKLVNFLGIYLGTGLTEFEFTRDGSNNIILLVGINGSGKTTVLSEMTPYPHESNGPRVKSRVIPGTVGIKELDILVDNYVLYKIKIVYDTNKAQTKCFIRKIIDGNDQELNPNGNVESYINIIEDEFRITKEFTSIGYLTKNVKNFVEMKPAERNNHVSEWLVEIAEFLDAYKISSKILTKLKRQIDSYNKEIGNMSSINYELELNFINSSINNINERINEISNNITQLNTYQDQIKTLVHTDQELNDYKVQYFNMVNRINSSLNEFYNKYQSLNELNISSNVELEDELNKTKYHIDNIKDNLDMIESKLANIQSEIMMNNSMLNQDSKLKQCDLNTIIDTVDNNTKLSNEIKNSLNEYISKYNVSDINELICENQSDLSKFQFFIKTLDEKFISLNNIIPFDYIKDMSKLEDVIKEKQEINNKINEIINKSKNELDNINKEIYRYTHGNIDSQILMKRPDFCKDNKCAVIEELLKYIDPQESLKELYQTSDKLTKDISEKQLELTNIDDELKKIQKSYEIMSEIDSFVYKNADLIAFMPPIIRNLVSEDTGTIYTHINEITLILQDLIEINSMYYKYDELIKSINDLNNIKNLITTNNFIEEKIKNYLIEAESLKKEKQDLTNNYFKLLDRLDTLRNYSDKIKERDRDLVIYNSNVEYANKCKHNLLILNKNKYVYDSNNICIDKLNKEKLDLQNQLFDLNKKRDEMTTYYVSKKQIEKMRNEIQEEFNKVNVLNKIWSPKVGYPSLMIQSFLNQLTIKTNEDLEKMWGSSLRIEEFVLKDSEFSIRINKDGNIIPDASLCSGGETATLNTAISFAMIETNISENGYDLIRMDEIDGVLDDVRRQQFIPMVQDSLETLDCNTCAIISHNNEFEDVACDIILMKGANIPEEKLKNKTILWEYK